MPKNTMPFAADSTLRSPGPKRSWRRRLRALILAAIGAAAGFWILEQPQDSPFETVAVIRQRPATQAEEDPALAIEQIASQILSPAQIGAARQQTQPASRRSEAELASSAEALRGRLRVDVAPGDSQRPWTIAIRSTDDRADAQIAALVNALAEQYCQNSQAAAVIREERSYHDAQAAADQARQAVKQAQQELDRRLDRFARLAESARAKQAAVPETHSPPAATNTNELPLRAEAVRQLAELEAQRDSLLERLLPAHPDVQAIEVEIGAAQARLNQLPPEAPAKTAPGRAVAVDSLAKEVAQAVAALAEQQRSLSQMENHALQLSSAERRTAERLLLCMRDRVATISSTATVASNRSKPNRRATFAALSIALVMGWLAGRGRPSPSSAFHEPSQLEAALGVPIVGVLSADDRRSEDRGRKRRPAPALS